MNGSFHIVCTRKADGTTGLSRECISAPWHLSKPYWDGEVLLIQAVNATAGIFAGDHLTMKVEARPGASVLLTSPSASRIHTMPDGQASLTQSITVAADAWLEWMPELFIPQRNCRYRQETEIDIVEGGQFYGVETLAPGRVAHGESFAFSHLSWRTRVRYRNQLVLAETYPMTPSNSSLADLRRGGSAYYFANGILVLPGIVPLRGWQKELSETAGDGLFIGATELDEHVYLFRILAGSSERLKAALVQLRALLAATVPRLSQPSRKL